MSHKHDHHDHAACECGHEELRHGARLQDGDAHSVDHERWSRRDFMYRFGLGSLGASFMFGRNPITAFGSTPLLNAIQSAGTDRVLILIQMNGGNDGLNMVVPVNNDIYYQRRPTIAIPKNQSILLDSETGIHPAMGALEPMWTNGNMSVVHNVGYPNQTRSHFEGTVNWSTARNQGSAESTGWLGRYLVDGHPDIFSNPADYPLAVRVGGPATLFQSTAGNLSVTFGDAQDFQRFINQGGFYDANNVPSTVYGSELAFVRNVTNASFRYVESVQVASQNGSNQAEYPNSGLAQSLAVIARMLRGGLGTTLYTVSRGGFDTHSNQGSVTGGHAGLVGDVASSVAAFYEDLAADGLDQRVMVMTFSEFGRTLSENGSRGTDHGSAAPMMLFGTGLAGGIYGTPSNLTTLQGGEPVHSTDYRSVYATVLQDWFGLEDGTVNDILGASFARMGFVEDKLQVGLEQGQHANSFELRPNYPNPFSDLTTIEFDQVSSGHVKLDVYSIEGRHVQTLIDDHRPSGRQSVEFRSGRLPSGTYLYRLTTSSGTQTRQMTLLK
ncbi:MAG: DUF1501 domain-containing protein [Bacteroidetes bacterium]|nr:DUF1501 domain-containing protein [Bacteroidota bacterium]